jgi:hypothetical protein
MPLPQVAEQPNDADQNRELCYVLLRGAGPKPFVATEKRGV